MLYLICVVLVVAAVLLVVIGAATASALPYIGAAITSAIVVALLWRRVRGSRENVFVTDPPVSTASQWDRPIRRSTREPVPEGVDIPPVAIARYDDLVAAEVLPSLETLSVDELQAVILHERHGMGRQAIIRRAEVLIDLTLGTGSAQRVTTVAAPVTTVSREDRVHERERLRGVEIESPRVTPAEVPFVRDEPEILPESPAALETPDVEQPHLQPDETKTRSRTERARETRPSARRTSASKSAGRSTDRKPARPKSVEAEGLAEPKAKRQRKTLKKDGPDLGL